MIFKPRTLRERNQLSMYGAFTPGAQMNTIRFAKNETLIHLIGKAIIAHKLRQRGNFLSEAYFDGGEFDIVDLAEKTAYEIVHTSNPPRHNLPEQIRDCFTVFVGDENMTIKELCQKAYKQANL